MQLDKKNYTIFFYLKLTNVEETASFHSFNSNRGAESIRNASTASTAIHAAATANRRRYYWSPLFQVQNRLRLQQLPVGPSRKQREHDAANQDMAGPPTTAMSMRSPRRGRGLSLDQLSAAMDLFIGP